MNDIIETKNLSRQFGKKHALSDVSIRISEHSLVGVIGRNGSGKTTLLKIIAGLLDQSSGEVKVFGEAPMDHLGVLSQLVYSYHNIGYEKRLHLKTILYAYERTFSKFDSVFANKLMNYFELSGKMRYGNLSQGMGSAFNFLCALSCRAPLTIFDEPVLGMDVTVRKAVYDILLRDFSEHPRTLLISSHLLSEIEGLLSDMILIEQGKLLLSGSIDEIRQSSYRVDGSEVALQHFVKGKRIIAQSAKGLSCFAIIDEPLTESTIANANAQGLVITSVRAEELSIYLTQKNKEGEFECLW